MSLDKLAHDMGVERLRAGMRKHAGFWQGLKKALTPGNIGEHAGGAIIGAGVAAGLTAAGSGISSGFGALMDRVQKPKAYKGMVEAAPGLRKRDQKKVQLAFNSLYSLNPTLAKDPLTASSFVERSLTRSDAGDSAGAYVDVQTAKDLLRSRPQSDDGIARAMGAGHMPQRPETPRRGPDLGGQAKLEQYKAQLRHAGDRAKGGKGARPRKPSWPKSPF